MKSECEGLVFFHFNKGPLHAEASSIRKPVLALRCLIQSSEMPSRLPTCMYIKAVETHAKHKENVTEKRVGEINARYPELPFLIFGLTRVERSLFYPQSSRSEPMRSTFLTPHCRRKPSSSGHQSPIKSSTSFGKSSPRSIALCHR